MISRKKVRRRVRFARPLGRSRVIVRRIPHVRRAEWKNYDLSRSGMEEL